MSVLKRKTAALLCVAIGLSGCATMPDRPLTVREKISGCVGMVALGAGIGAIIGNNTGDGNAKKGATTGAIVGAGACAVWYAFENEKDKQRIAQLQMEAVRTGQPQNARWYGADGRERGVVVSPSSQTEMSVLGPDGVARTRYCRPLNTTASVSGQSDTLNEVWCRNDDGSYSPSRAAP